MFEVEQNVVEKKILKHLSSKLHASFLPNSHCYAYVKSRRYARVLQITCKALL